ncbi:MAG: NTP transferase domain-containing protein [Ruminococcus sp.]|jgi:choline kinase|nr:NTP transferase domain-containing protein [Ruminococcus sp.]
MTYIILAAGKGVNLQPLTLKTPKSLYKLNRNTTVLQRMVRLIRKNDTSAEIVVVAGFMYEQVTRELERENVIIVRNPFYSTTGSIASLWFAKKYLERDNVTIMNSDIVAEEKLVEEVICKNTDVPYVLVDSSKTEGKYNVQVNGDRICVMSKALSSFYAQYVSITKLDAVSARFLIEEIDNMVNGEMYDQLFEDALVQMIFENDFDLYYKDIKDYSWSEIDNVDDLLKAREV